MYQLFFVLCRPNELHFTQLTPVTLTTVRPVARITQQGGHIIECMQELPRKKSLATCKFIHIYLDSESYADMNVEPAEHRHLLFCNLGKGRNKK